MWGPERTENYPWHYENVHVVQSRVENSLLQTTAQLPTLETHLRTTSPSRPAELRMRDWGPLASPASPGARSLPIVWRARGGAVPRAGTLTSWVGRASVASRASVQAPPRASGPAGPGASRGGGGGGHKMMKFRFRRQGADPQREKLKQELFAFHKVRRRGRRRLGRATSGRLCPVSAALLGRAWSGSQAVPRAAPCAF